MCLDLRVEREREREKKCQILAFSADTLVVGNVRVVLIPAVDVFAGRKDFLAGLHLFLEKSLEVEEFFAGDFVFEHAEPAVVEGFDFELEEALLLVCQAGHPSFLVELGVEGGGRGG